MDDDIRRLLSKCEGFDWDEHNTDKNRIKHEVNFTECEESFFNKPLVAFNDVKHSECEHRFYSLGHSNEGRLLFIVFTLRDNKIRVISARDMNKKEREAYEKYEENS